MSRALGWKPWQDFRIQPGDHVLVHGSDSSLLFADSSNDLAEVLDRSEAAGPLEIDRWPTDWPDWLWPVRWPDGGVVVVDEAMVEVVTRAGRCPACGAESLAHYDQGIVTRSLCDGCQPAAEAARDALAATSEDEARGSTPKSHLVKALAMGVAMASFHDLLPTLGPTIQAMKGRQKGGKKRP